MSIQRQVIVAVSDDEEQTQALQPIGIDHPSEVRRAHLGPPRSLDEHTVPANAGCGGVAFHVLEPHGEPTLHRPGELTPQIGKIPLRIHGKILQNPGQIGEQGFLSGLLVLQLRQFLGTAVQAEAHRFERRKALGPCMLDVGKFAAGVALQSQQTRAVLIDLPDEFLRLRHPLLDGIQALQPSTREVSVKGSHAPRIRRVALSEQQFDFILGTDQIGGSHERGEGISLADQRLLVAVGIGLELGTTPPQSGLGHAQRVELLPLGSHVELGNPQPGAQCIALFELIRQPTRHRRNSSADVVELGLGLGRLSGLVSAERAVTADEHPEDAEEIQIPGGSLHRLGSGEAGRASIQALCPLLYCAPEKPEVSCMPRLFDYLSHHPYLAGGAVLVAIALVAYEIQARLQAFAALSAMQAVRLMNQGALVLDLRAKESFEAGHIGDARNVPAAELAAQAETLKKWRDKTVITYDDSGSGGATGARTLMKLGFKQVFNLEGGLNAWVKDNLPLAKGSGGRSGGK